MKRLTCQVSLFYKLITIKRTNRQRLSRPDFIRGWFTWAKQRFLAELNYRNTIFQTQRVIHNRSCYTNGCYWTRDSSVLMRYILHFMLMVEGLSHWQK